MNTRQKKIGSSSQFCRVLNVRMRAPIGFGWQGLLWAGKLFTERENDGQFPAVKLSGRRAAKTHPSQDSCWHTQREQNGEKNERQSKREVGHRLKIWTKTHHHCVDGWLIGDFLIGFVLWLLREYAASMRIDHWHNFVDITANLVATCWHSIALLPSAQFTRSFHEEIHID